MAAIYGVGETMTLDIAQWCRDQKNKKLLSDLTHHGVIPTLSQSSLLIKPASSADRGDRGGFVRNPLSANHVWFGKKICVTGTFPVSRDAIHEAIEAVGGTVMTTVSKQTDILLAGENA